MYAIGQEKGIDIDMNNGTGWPFGGPTVSLADAASKLVWTNAIVQGDGETEVSQDISASESGTTLSCVMAYPQGETVGSVMDVTEYVDGKFLRWKAPSGSWRIIAVYNGHTMQKVKAGCSLVVRAMCSTISMGRLSSVICQGLIVLS